MKKLYPFLVLLVPVLMFAQQDMNTMMTSDTTAMMEDTTAVMEETAPAMEEEPMYDTTMFGEETEAPAMEDEYMVESEGAKALGITAGVNLGYPIWKSSGLANNDTGLQFGVIVGTPYGLELGPLAFGVGAEIGYYSFPYPNNTANEAKGVVALATVNTMLYDTGSGPISLQLGGGYYGSSVGATAGASFDYSVGDTGVLVRGYARANATLDSGSNVGSVSWISVGAMISYDLSGMF